MHYKQYNCNIHLKRPIVTLNALREFCMVEIICHLGNNSQSEHCIQQMDHSKTKEKACKAAWVNMMMVIFGV